MNSVNYPIDGYLHILTSFNLQKNKPVMVAGECGLDGPIVREFVVEE